MQKRLIFAFLALFALFPMGFSCYNNSFEIKSSNNLENVYIMLLTERIYNDFSDNAFLYYSADSLAKIRVSNDSIIIQAVNESIDWEKTLSTELFLLWSYYATDLAEEDIMFISNLDCCGVYESGMLYSSLDKCEESIIIPQKSNSGLLLALMIFFTALIVLIYCARKDFKKYLAFLAGGFGWAIALALRMPLVNNSFISESIVLAIFVPALLSGVFEESIRFLGLKFLKFAKKGAFLFGLGWGFFEAMIVYGAGLAYMSSLNQGIGFFAAFPGFIERISAMILHLSLTVFVLKSLENKRLLLLAILIHSGLNLSAVLMLFYGANVWVIEAFLLLSAILAFYAAIKINGKKDGKKSDSGKAQKRK